MTKSSKTKSAQVAKPYDGFPLTAHPSGRWCKKHRQKQFYFGPLADWQAALAKYEREWPHIIQDKKPPADGTDDGCTMAVLCNKFLNTKRRAMEADELSPRTFHEYQRITDAMIQQFGKLRLVEDLQPADFESFRTQLSKRYGPVTLSNAVNRFRIVFKYASDNRLIATPVNYGQGFKRPSQRNLRKARNEAGPRLFTAAEIHRIMEAAGTGGRAMILLGINCGFGNSDIANIPQSALDLTNGWCEFTRPKTEIRRRIPLWPETIAALRKAIRIRPAAADKADADCVFLTNSGNRWVRVQESRKAGALVSIDAVAKKFTTLLRRLEINGRKNLGFYTLRHNLQTIGGNAKDPDAVAAIMGHVDSSMGAVYRERIDDDRLRSVVEVIHAWLWPPDDDGDAAKG